MKLGFSLSPGGSGLLLPYHLGALDALEYRGFLNDATPLAGASAGAIATASKAAKIDSLRVLDATIKICDRCFELGGARGRLMPLLKQNLATHMGDEQFHTVTQRKGGVAIAYMEIFPRRRSVLQTEFFDRFDLVNAVCHSSMFPFFTSNWPAILDTSRQHPRLVVDGVFTVPFERVGCPDFKTARIHVDRTIRISVIPQALTGQEGARENCISPRFEGAYQLGRLIRLATEGASQTELTALYESGWSDAEKWCAKESLRGDDCLGNTMCLN
jgi:hypothetical protein